jgi:septum formation topological specificity factor MinE
MQGVRVRIVGLVRRADLNGLDGVCKNFATSDTDKVHVLLDNGTQVHVLAANLLLRETTVSSLQIALG